MIVDLNVRQRLAKIRRNFLTLGWGSSSEPEAPQTGDRHASPDRDLILEDTLAGYTGISTTNGVEWRAKNPGLFDDAEAWTPSPETRAAIFGLAEKIRAEGESLVSLSSRARREVEQLVKEHAQAANGIRTKQGNASWEVHLATMNELVREIGTTALSAALSAIRAGASTRGFSQVARGVDELERALRSAWDEIEVIIVDLEDRAAKTAATSANLRTTGKAVAQSAAALPRSAPINGETASAMAAELDQLKLLTSRIARTGGEIAMACDEMAHLVHTLAEQLVVVVRETPVGNRRIAKRIAFEASCIISTSDKSYPGKSLDLSATGALIKVRQETSLQRAQPITLHLQDVAPIIGTVADVSAQGVHIFFDLGHGANAAAKPALMKMLDSLLARSQDLIDRTAQLARELKDAMELGVAEGLVSPEELLSTEYEPIMGTAPQQFRHPALPFYEQVLTPILEAFRRDAPNVVYATAMDRGGYVPVHKRAKEDGREARQESAPIRSRRRRIYADWLSQRAARNLRPFLIQITPVEATSGDIADADSVRSVSVPIFIGGRHWGCAEIGYKLEDGDAAFSTIGV